MLSGYLFLDADDPDDAVHERFSVHVTLAGDWILSNCFFYFRQLDKLSLAELDYIVDTVDDFQFSGYKIELAHISGTINSPRIVFYVEFFPNLRILWVFSHAIVVTENCVSDNNYFSTRERLVLDGVRTSISQVYEHVVCEARPNTLEIGAEV